MTAGKDASTRERARREITMQSAQRRAAKIPRQVSSGMVDGASKRGRRKEEERCRRSCAGSSREAAFMDPDWTLSRSAPSHSRAQQLPRFTRVARWTVQ